MKNIDIKIIIIIFLVAFFSLLQGQFEVFKIKPLKGAITNVENAKFSLKTWFSGEFQEKKEKYWNDNFGFRNLFVRLNNQIAFTFFNKANANGVIIGKNNCFYEENYLKAYCGLDFIGKEKAENLFDKIKFIQDTLAKLNKTFIVVFAAGKATYFPENIPEEYILKRKEITNFEYYNKLIKEKNINSIDFNSYFAKNRYLSKYPLYPYYGIHWSYYGSCIAADSIIRYVEKIRKIDLPNIKWNEVEIKKAQETDFDISEGLNVLFEKKDKALAYPKLEFESLSNKSNARFLINSDSFFWLQYNFGMLNLFPNSHFWYYNSQIYPETFSSELLTSNVSISEQINKHDVFVVLSSECNLPKIGWGFIDNLYNHFNGKSVDKYKNTEEYKSKVKNLVEYIKTDKQWFDKVKKDALEQNKSLDAMLFVNASWTVIEEFKKSAPDNYTQTVEYINKVKNLAAYIKTDKQWFDKVKKEAIDQNVSIDSTLLKHARWQVLEDYKKMH